MKETEHWLALYHAPGLSSAAARALVEHYGGAGSVCAAKADELRGLGANNEAVRFLRAPDGERFEQDLKWLEQDGHTLVVWRGTHYPMRLREIKDPPLLLFAMGDVALLSEPQIAVVGTRRPTPGGLESARHFADALARSGLIVVSGLAAGIDAAAHEAALNASGPTIAVIGTGADIVYPAKHKVLAHRIVDHGVIVSEFSCGTPAHASNFPRRNRLMSGLSLGVLVIEAAERSGTLITARFAGEQGREVFAVPGAIRNPVARGCHRLIQQGAKLAQSAEDILIELAPLIELNPPSATAASLPEPSDTPGDALPDALSQGALDAEHQSLLRHMGYDEPLSVDALVERSELTAAEVSSILLIMELEGYVSCDSHLYTRIK